MSSFSDSESHPLRNHATDSAPAPALEDLARARLSALVVGLAFLHVVLAIGHILNPEGWDLNSPLSMLQSTPWSRIPAFVVASATAFFLFVLRLLLPRLPLCWSHPLGTLVATLVVINALGWFTLGVTPEKTLPVTFAVVGAAFLLFTPRSLVLVVVVALAGWSGFAATARFSEGWLFFGSSLAAACLLALLFQRLQLKTIKEMLRGVPVEQPENVIPFPVAATSAEQEEKFRRWYEATFEGIAIHEKGVILEANQALAALLHCDLASLSGQNLLDWFTRASRDVIEESILLGNFRPFEAVARRKDKTEVHLELFTKRMAHGGKEVMVTAFRDATERRRTAEAMALEQERLHQQFRRQTALAEIFLHSGEDTEVARNLERIAAAAATVVSASGGACILVWEEGGVGLAAAHLSPQAKELRFDPVLQLARVAEWVSEKCDSFVASQVSRDDPFEVNHPVAFLSAYLALPLIAKANVVGVLFVLESGDPRHFKPDELDFLNALAGRGAQAIHNARLYADLRETNRRLQKQNAMLQAQHEQAPRERARVEAAGVGNS